MSTPSSKSRLLTSREVQAYLRIGRSKTMQLLQDGEIPSFYYCGRYRIREDDLLEYLERSRYTK